MCVCVCVCEGVVLHFHSQKIQQSRVQYVHITFFTALCTLKQAVYMCPSMSTPGPHQQVPTPFERVTPLLNDVQSDAHSLPQ